METITLKISYESKLGTKKKKKIVIILFYATVKWVKRKASNNNINDWIFLSNSSTCFAYHFGLSVFYYILWSWWNFNVNYNFNLFMTGDTIIILKNKYIYIYCWFCLFFNNGQFVIYNMNITTHDNILVLCTFTKWEYYVSQSLM